MMQFTVWSSHWDEKDSLKMATTRLGPQPSALSSQPPQAALLSLAGLGDLLVTIPLGAGGALAASMNFVKLRHSRTSSYNTDSAPVLQCSLLWSMNGRFPRAWKPRAWKSRAWEPAAWKLGCGRLKSSGSSGFPPRAVP